MTFSSPCKRTISLLLAFLMVVTGMFPGIPAGSGRAYADGPISVSEALQAASGSKVTVEGYIVGYTQNGPTYITTGIPDNNNLAIADLPGETDKTRIMPVQLTSSFRPDFGLKTNPSLIGTKIVVTGTAETYFTVKGIKSPTAIEPADSSIAPQVLASPPSGATIPKGTGITLSTSVTASVYYSVYADGSPDAFPVNQLYTGPVVVNNDQVLIKAYSSVPGKTDSPVTEFSYTAKTPVDGLTIAQIQGAGLQSPYRDELVTNVRGVVTSIKDSGTAYMQSLTPDEDDRTSEAIMIYKASHGLNAGDVITVNGQVKEWREAGYEGSLDQLTTEISASSITLESRNQPLPDPVVLGAGGRTLPTVSIDSDPSSFDPSTDGLDFFESLEGMRLQLNTPRIIGPYDYEIPVVVDNGPGNENELYSPAGGLVLNGEDYNPQRILIAKKPASPVRTGQQFAGNITGILGYDYGNYKLLPEGELPAVIQGTSADREITAFTPAEDKLTVASFNVENFSVKSGTAKINNIAKAIVTNLNSPDIIGLLEVQDNDGSADSGTVDASKSYEALISAIRTQGGPDYAFTDIAPVDKQDGGASGGNIRVGFLYNPERTTLKPSPGGKGDSVTAVTYGPQGLSHNPGRIRPEDPAFIASRKPLAAEFLFHGQEVLVIANHFNSKTGDSGLFGSIQPPVRPSEAQRAEIAKVVNGFVKEVLTANPRANVVVLGDLNDFQFSNTLSLLRGTELTNLVDRLPAEERYSYIYQGNSQTLDHILVNNRLADSSVLDMVHINADYMVEDGRVSDHDPLLAQIALDPEPETDGFSLRILHTNDTHANLDTKDNSPDNIARRITAIKQSRQQAKHSILVDAGDVFSGTLYFNKYEGLADLAFMNLIGYDAMTFGNHEFDRGPSALYNFVSKAAFPFVSSNIDFGKEPALSGLFKEGQTAGTAANAAIYPYMVKEIGGERIGLIGLTTEETEILASPGPNIRFNNHVESARAAVQALEAAGVDKIVALSHLGYNVDQALADQVAGIDIIVGGHSHTKLDRPEIRQAHGYPQLIVQAHEKSNYLGELDVTFNPEGVITSYDGRLVDLNAKTGGSYTIPADPEALELLNKTYKPGVEELSGAVVGESAVLLDGIRDNVRSKETNLGNVITDAMRIKAEADVAIQNGGGIRASIDIGGVTQGEVITVLPFNNDLVTLEMTGQEIIDSLEIGVSTVETKQGRFPHVSGMKYYYDSTKPPLSRIVSVQILKDGQYTPIDPAAMYTVATNAFIAGGGDGYTPMEKAKKAGRINLLYYPDFEVLTEYISKHSPIKAETEGRITDLKGQPLPTAAPTQAPSSAPSAVPSPTPSASATPTPAPDNGGGGTGSALSPSPVPSASAAPSPAPSAQAGVTVYTPEQLAGKLASAEGNVVEIAIVAEAGRAELRLPAETLFGLPDAERNRLILQVRTDGMSYSLPLSVLNVKALQAQFSNGKPYIGIRMERKPGGFLESVRSRLSAAAGVPNAAPIAPVVEYAVFAQSGMTNVPINDFGSTYVSRTLTLTRTVDPNTAAGVMIDPVSGAVAFVPTLFTNHSDGTSTATLKRGGNSLYTIIETQRTFNDIGDHWAKPSVERLASKLIVSGTGENRFAPSRSVTRAEFAAWIVRSLGMTPSTVPAAFDDVPADAWYAEAVRTASASRLISGYADGSFKPGQPISRQEMAAILAKAMKYAGKTLTADASALAPFSDAAGIPAWSRTSVAEIAAQGIIQGMPDGTFAPDKPATRAEAATMLEKMLRSVEFIN